MEALVLVVILAWCAAVALAMPSDRHNWRLRQLVDRHERMTP
jgi:hypothetical protein